MKAAAYIEDDIDDRLRDWGVWAGAEVWVGLGMPRETLIYQMVRCGIIARGYGYKPEPEHREEEITDKAVTALTLRDRKLGLAIYIQYVIRGQTWQKAKDMHVTETKFKELVREGKRFLAGWFDHIDIAALAV